ncbi:MAG: hypothetical protein ACYTG0_11265 [Planctomycetota bacterium]|jgi:hypothetical protein
METGEHCYRHSGRIGLLGIPLLILYGGLTAGAAGYVSALLYLRAPVILVVGFAIGQAFAVGFAVLLAGRHGKVRNSIVLFLSGAGAGVGSVLTAFFVSDSLLAEGLTPAFNPYVLWGAAGPLIVFVAGVIPMATLGDSPFCETCNAWIKAEESHLLTSAFADPAAMQKRLAEGDLSALRELAESTDCVPGWTSVVARQCPTCAGPAYVTVKTAATVGQPQGPPQLPLTIVENLAVDAETIEKIGRAATA